MKRSRASCARLLALRQLQWRLEDRARGLHVRHVREGRQWPPHSGGYFFEVLVLTGLFCTLLYLVLMDVTM